MNKNVLAAVVAVVCLVGFGLDAAGEDGGKPSRNDRPKLHWKDLDFDAGETPLQNAIRGARNGMAHGKKNGMDPGEKKDKCALAIANDDAKKMAQFCDVPELDTQKLGKGPIKDGNGNIRGRRNVTQTTLMYDEPKQRGKAGQPEQETWDPLAIRGKKWGAGDHPGIANQHGANGGKGRSGQLSRGQAVLPESWMNNDHDCLDRVSGDHLRDGQCYEADAGGVLIEDANHNHTLLQTLLYGADAECPTEGADTVPCCRHVGSGALFFGDPADSVPDDCWDESGTPIGTTLQELIDEDGPEDVDNDGDGAYDEDVADGQNNDNDCVHYSDFVEAEDQPTAPGQDKKYRREVQHGTGAQCVGEGWKALVDEDGPEGPIDDDGDELVDEDWEESASVPGVDPDDAADYARCVKLYGKFGMEFAPEDDWIVDPVTKEGQCNLDRAIVKLGNDKCAADDNPDESKRCSKQARGGKLFKADEHGRPDPDGDGHFEVGKEKRKVSLIETFGVKCKHGQTYDEESGLCVEPLVASGSTLRLGPPLGLDASPADDAVARQAMMGFTFGPPVLEWGWRVKVNICIDFGFFDFCFELFYARVGYEFDLAAGLRLPVQVEVEGLPDDILASVQEDIQTSLTPLDFTAADYTAFCEHHDLDSAWYIANCTDRFAFPDALNADDGDELVAYYEVFAGIVVRVLGIPLINWAIDSAMDLPAACTMWKILGLTDASIMDMLELLSDPGGAYETLKGQGVICGSFTTPFGHDNGKLRTFPFASYSFDVRADCLEAMARGEVIKLGSKTVPLCTNMILGVSGANLGIGLGMDLNVGSNLITAEWSTAGDARASPAGATSGDTLEFEHSSNEGGSALTVGPVYFDNWELTEPGGAFVDDGRIVLDDFVYYINTIVITLRAKLMFGGILSPIPDIASFELFTFEFNARELTEGGFDGIPIPQHPGTEPVVLSVPVENYALEVEVAPGTADPALLDPLGALKITPGEPGRFHVKVHNAGSRVDDFTNFAALLTNNPFADSEMSDLGVERGFNFVVDPNTDRDCVALGGSCLGGGRLRGWPACYADETLRVPWLSEVIPCIDEDGLGPAGAPRELRDEDGDGWPDEDPSDVWLTAPEGSELAGQVIASVSAHALSDGLLELDVIPYRHPLTAPGLYGFRIAADSVNAVALGMPAEDASHLRRTDAWDVGYFRVESFYDPQVTTVPLESAGLKPGIGQEYEVEGTNAGNNDDAMSVVVSFKNFNQAECTLTTMGRLPEVEVEDPDCPYRAVPTVIDEAWTDFVGLTEAFPNTYPADLLVPLGSESDTVHVTVPREWAGMDDTTYEYEITVTSLQDPSLPPATNKRTVGHHVTATTESMTRYIGLEIQQLIDTILALNAVDVKTAGLLHIAAKPLLMQNEKAKDKVLAGDVEGACKTHTTGTRLAAAFLHALEGSGKKLEEGVYNDLHARGEAILADQTKAAAAPIPSAP